MAESPNLRDSSPASETDRSSTNVEPAFSDTHPASVASEWEPRDKMYKRPLDLAILLAAHMFPLLIPLWIVLWTLVPIAIWLEDRGPVFYVQRRVGRGGVTFRVLKFRTMRVNEAEGMPTLLAEMNDPRVTHIGKILRRTALDELPQLLSILKGDMSFVGPRPEPSDVNEKLLHVASNSGRRLTVRPGLTGLAQVHGGYHARLRDKMRYDLLYIQRVSLWLDVRLILFSGWLTLRGRWDTIGAEHRSRKETRERKAFQIRRRYKRPMDLTILIVAHAFLLPAWILLWTLIPFLIWLEDRGPVFYVQERMGLNGRKFPLFKFRTMRKKSSDETWSEFTSDDDARITRVGSVLRRLALDELPQVINLWMGHMSFVGPRPLPTAMHEEYLRENPRFAERLNISPGLTGPSQVKLPRHVNASERLQRDLLYMQEANVLVDLKLITHSVWLTVMGRWGRDRRKLNFQDQNINRNSEEHHR